MNTMSFGNYQWSAWCGLDNEIAKQSVPDKPGIYEIRTDFEFGRLKGSSQILSIGRAVPSLQKRLSKGRFSDLIKDLDRPEKWLFNANRILEFHYIVTTSGEEAKWLEALRQWEYENEHWELPPGNDRLEKAAIFRRIEQQYGRFNESKLKALLQQHQTTEKVASFLGIPYVIIDNLKVYWMV
jgi:hypothetical protein